MMTEYIRGIVAFVQVAEVRSFTLAGSKVGLSKSAMTKAITSLEHKIGFQLFIRTTRNVVLTNEGRIFYEICAKALNSIDDVKEWLVASKEVPSGRLRVDMPVVFGRRWILPALLDIAACHPQIDMDLSFTDHRIDAVEDGVDLVIRVGDLDDTTSMVARQLGVQNAAVCATPAYIDTHAPLLTLDDLDNHTCIRFRGKSRSLPWSFMTDDGEIISKLVKGQVSLNNSEAILDAALSDCGPALLSTWLISDDVKSGRLKILLPHIRPQGFPVFATWPQKAFLSAKTRLVVDDLVKKFMPTPPWSESLSI